MCYFHIIDFWFSVGISHWFMHFIFRYCVSQAQFIIHYPVFLFLFGIHMIQNFHCLTSMRNFHKQWIIAISIGRKKKANVSYPIYSVVFFRLGNINFREMVYAMLFMVFEIQHRNSIWYRKEILYKTHITCTSNNTSRSGNIMFR